MLSKTKISSAALIALAGVTAVSTTAVADTNYCWVSKVKIENNAAPETGQYIMTEVRARAYNPFDGKKVDTTINNPYGNAKVPEGTSRMFDLKELGAAKNGWEFYVDFRDGTTKKFHSCEGKNYRLVYDADGSKDVTWTYKFNKNHDCLHDPASKAACVPAPKPKDGLITR